MTAPAEIKTPIHLYNMGAILLYIIIYGMRTAIYSTYVARHQAPRKRPCRCLRRGKGRPGTHTSADAVKDKRKGCAQEEHAREEAGAAHGTEAAVELLAEEGKGAGE